MQAPVAQSGCPRAPELLLLEIGVTNINTSLVDFELSDGPTAYETFSNSTSL